MSTIRCTVDNCTYWGQDNFCTAQQILVVAPHSPLPNADPMGSHAESLEHTPAHDQEETACYTFRSKR
ncbi:MAG: DUF1540 domain-containing protein [Chloroflexota bacterium]